MFGIEAFEEEERLEKLEERLGSARFKKVDHCIKCGFCCNKRTCIPTPDELVEIAKFLKTTLDSLISTKFIVDRKSRLSSPYFVRPAGSNILDLVGKFVPTKRTWGEGACVFLENNECKIYGVRPRSAKVQECWNNTKITYAPAETWENNILKSKFGIDGSQLEDESDLQSDIDWEV